MTRAFREFDLLRDVYARNSLLPNSVLVPPGDDMAAIDVNGRTLLIAVDQVVGGRHVLPTTPPSLVGRKAVVRNVSDVAAMAARPVATVVAAALPADYGADRSDELFEALRATAAQYGCPLIGGDLTIHADPAAPLVCSVTILAQPAWPGARIVTRRGARVGDRVFVTGRLGGSLDPDGGGHHLHAEPRVNEAVELLRQLGDQLRAMIDISDGLGRDAAHLVASGSDADEALQIEIDAERIPTNRGLPWMRALSDGEDYELLFITDGAGCETPSDLLGTPVTEIGRVQPRRTGNPSVVVRWMVGSEDSGMVALMDASRDGWEHAGETQ